MRVSGPPAATDVEQSVLALLLRDLGLVGEARGEVSPEDFSTPGRAVLFATMAGVVEAAEGEEVGVEDIAGQLEVLRGVDGRAGEIAALGLEELEALMSIGPPAGSDERLRFDLRRVREMADVRRALREGPAVTAAAAEKLAAAAAAAPGEAAPEGPVDLEGRLRLLKRLHEEALITGEEYAAKRKQLLDLL